MASFHNSNEAPDDSEPRYKRRRTAIACDSCRRRKTKCNGVRPACDICISMGFVCSYPKSSRSSLPSRNDVEYIRQVEDRLVSLESMLETVVSQVALVREAPKDSSSTQAISSSESMQRAPSNGLYDNISRDTGAPNISDPPSTTADLAGDTVDGMGVIAFADEFASAHFGGTSNPAFSNKINHALKEALNSNKRQAISQAADGDIPIHISRPPSPYAMVSEKLASSPQFTRCDAFALPSTTKITQLVDSFFSHTGLLFPYIHEKSIHDGIVLLRQRRFGEIRRSWLSLLNTIMAFATILAPRPERQNDWISEADTFLQRALQLLPNVALQPANIEILQALLLLTQYLQGTQRSTQTYNFQSLTVRVAFQIGLHCSASSSKDTILDREIKNRCWCMTYILDKTCSMTFGRPPYLPTSYFQSPQMNEVDLELLESNPAHGPAEGNGVSTVSCFSSSVKLYIIVGKIIENIYGSNIPRDTDMDYDTLIQQVTSLESQLESWKLALPVSLGVKTREQIILDPAESSQLSRLSTVLTLRYLSARMLLHRAILQRFLETDLQKSQESRASVFLKNIEKTSLDLCVSSAIDLIDIHYEVSKSCRPMLTTYWFSLYYVFSSALVLFAAIIVHERHGIPIDSLQSRDKMSIFQNALDALEYLGSESRMASRCRKYLKKFLHGVMSLDSLSAAPREQNLPGQDFTFDNFTIPFSESSEISPMGMGLDMGPFMAEVDWEVYV